MNRKIVIIGAGNVATHLVKALIKEGFDICQIYSRTHDSARELGLKIGVNYTNELGKIYTNADTYIFAVSDKALCPIVKNINFDGNPLLIHTAGSISKDIFAPYSKHYGVMYPLQTFSKKKDIDFKHIPICVEASGEESDSTIRKIAEHLSESVFRMDYNRRKYLHLAAVFACNFTNYMYSAAGTILEEHDIPFDILKPLIRETADKIETLSPDKAQTGPAVRNDREVMSAHKDLLKNNSDLQKLYTFVSNSIINKNRED